MNLMEHLAYSGESVEHSNKCDLCKSKTNIKSRVFYKQVGGVYPLLCNDCWETQGKTPSSDGQVSELVNCPFCGNNAITSEDWNEMMHIVMCHVCGGKMEGANKEEAELLWNKRSS